MPSTLSRSKAMNSIRQQFRERRFQFFLHLCQSLQQDKPLKILDIGGTQEFWKKMNFTTARNVHITLLNLVRFETENENFTSVIGSALDLSEYEDKAFDIVFSNSVIEHLFTFENQKKMADEVRRVGKCYFIQTPNYFFPIEPHFMFPLFHYFPRNMRIALISKFSIGNFPKATSREQAIDWVDERRLMTKKEMKRLFPDGAVYEEPFFGLTKSIALYKFNKTEV